MIFVTVGTHEQPFNRLIEKVDLLIDMKVIKEDVIVQTGYSTYEPKNCICRKLIPYKEMINYVNDARIIITHGGPSSFIMPLQIGKIPIVVPRKSLFGEHVNNHQFEFCRSVKERMNNIIMIDEIDELEEAISNYDNIVSEIDLSVFGNNQKFNDNIKTIVSELVDDE